MTDTDEPKYDKQGRLLAPDSGKLNCLVNDCEPRLESLPNPEILAVEVLRDVSLPPTEKPWPSLYHQAIAECRELCSGGEPSALKGDFLVHKQTFNGSRNATDNEFYVGLPKNFEADVEPRRTRLVDGFRARHLPEGLKIVAIQHILTCGICEAWMDIMVWTEDENAVGEISWDIIRTKAEYVIEEEDTDIEDEEE